MMVDEMNGELHVTTRKPSPPPDADFALFIDFKKGEGDPLRVFKTADQMVRALQKLDKTFCRSVDSSIKPIMVLEDIEAGSLRIWLKNILESTDDQALKDIDWKPAIGKYLVRAKYVYLQWANKPDGQESLAILGKEIMKIAEETDVKHLPDYAPPSAQELIHATKEIDSAKLNLISGDSMQYISADNDPVDFDLVASWDTEKLEEMSIKETTRFENMQMNLIVKKPDYLGMSMWEFRHGPSLIFARISDEIWLARYQKEREFDIRPGDALRCLVTVEFSYGFDNELIRTSYVIEQVDRVLENQVSKQGNLLTGNQDG